MPIALVCPECGDQFRVADKFLGKKIRCQRCGRSITVGDDGETMPEEPQAKAEPKRRRRPADDDLHPQRSRRDSARSRTLWIWSLAGGGAAVLLVVIAVVLALNGSRTDTAKPHPDGKQFVDAGGGNAKPEPPLTPEEAAEKKQLVDSQLLPTPSELPGAKAADRSNSKVVKIVAKNWDTLRADPEEQPLAVLAADIPLEAPADQLRQIRFTRPSLAQAAVVVRAPAGPDRFTIRLDRVDLLAGKGVGSWTLYTEPQSPSPFFQVDEYDLDLWRDGTRVALNAPGRRRLDIYSFEDGKHIVGWLPYEQERLSQFITWFGFVQANLMLTLNHGGKLVLWQLPECRAVYEIHDVKGAPCWSAHRKHLLAAIGTSLAILDPTTGECRGLLETGQPGLGAYQNAGFSRDGKELTVSHGIGLYQMTRWDLATGRRRDTIDALRPGNLQFLESGLLMANTVTQGLDLYDWTLKAPLLQYKPVYGRAAEGSPDGRVWVDTGDKRNGKLKAVALPDKRVQKIQANLAKEGIAKVLTPGTPIKIRMVAPNEEFHDAALTKIRQRLQECRLPEGEGGLILSIEVSEQKGPRRLKIWQGPILPLKEVPELFVITLTTLTDASGNVIAQLPQKIQLPFIPAAISDYAREVEDFLRKEAQTRVANIPLASQLYRVGSKVRNWPDTALITAR